MISCLNRMVIVSLVCLSFSMTAMGYTRQFVDKENKTPIRWNEKSIKIGLSESLLKFGSRSEVTEKISAAFQVWEKETGLRFKFDFVKKESVSDLGSAGDGISLVTVAPSGSNLLLFNRSKQQNSAVTRLFYTQSGIIKEADIVLNPTARFTENGETGSFDLQSTLTHEVGHLLGFDHSSIYGASMHRHQGQNGLFGLAATHSRTLSHDDRAGARALYRNDSKEFGRIEGVLSRVELRPESTRHVWVESSETGEVLAGVEIAQDGTFSLDGLKEANYDLHIAYQNGDAISEQSYPISVRKGETAKADFEIPDTGLSRSGFTLGFNSQIGKTAIPLEAGSAYFITMSANDLFSRDLWLEFSSDQIDFEQDSLHRRYTDGVVDVLGLRLSTDAKLKTGDYSVRVYDSGILIANLAGHLTIDDVKNPWGRTPVPIP